MVFETTAGRIRFAMRPDMAPATARNFVQLAASGFYDGTVVHRVVPKGRGGRPFVIQGGDPTGTGDGGPGYDVMLEPSALPLLAQVAATLRAAKSLSVEIEGHTDDVGSALKNLRLSQKRAETIRAVLVKAGVSPARLVAKGYGPTRPRAPNTTAAGREQNRRVEFLILGEPR